MKLNKIGKKREKPIQEGMMMKKAKKMKKL